MLTCPFCGEENIDGADDCQKCRQPLDFVSTPKPETALEKSLLKDRVSMLAPRQPVVVEASTPVSEVIELLVGHSIGCLVVVDKGANGTGQQVVGIFSERDALVRLNTDVAELGHRPVSEFMTPNPETIESDAKIAFALHKMDIGGYRHLPVLTGGKISGVISIRDILDYITANLLAATD